METQRYVKPLREASPVKYVAAITFRELDSLKKNVAALEKRYGKVDNRSATYAFSHSNYYEKEMGPNLQKQFISFQRLQKIEELVNFKLFAMELESRFAVAGKRQVNIDPAYLELAKLVVATTKNYDHRIYLGQGIYGDVQLRFRNGGFVANDWTYQDYRSKPVIDFLTIVRDAYYEQLGRH